MRVVLLVIVVVGVLLALAFLAWWRARRPHPAPPRPVNEPVDADEVPEPGGPSAHRPSGAPAPGSRADRNRHGKP